MKFRTALAAIVALATFGAATGIAVADATSARSDVAASLAAIVPTGMEKADEKIDKALRHLDDAAAEAADGDMEKALEEDADAVADLTKALDHLEGADTSGVIAAAVQTIVGNAAAEAAAALDAAAASGADAKYLGKAQKHFDKGSAEASDGEFKDAIKAYADAIKYAGKAVAKGADDSDSGSTSDDGDFKGKYSEYTFWFVNIETGEETGPLTGSSHPDNPLGWTGKSNEGYLMVGGELMQLHVSCSDAFADGVGEKSDPSADSPWRVDHYSITKYSDGTADKSCDFVGLPMPSITVAKTYRVDGGDWFDTDAAAPDEVFTTQVFDFRFVVVNDGNVALDTASIVDDVFVVATTGNPECSTTSLAVGATLECLVSGVTLPSGAHINIATASGTVGGITVSVTDSVHLSVLNGPPPA